MLRSSSCEILRYCVVLQDRFVYRTKYGDRKQDTQNVCTALKYTFYHFTTLHYGTVSIVLTYNDVSTIRRKGLPTHSSQGHKTVCLNTSAERAVLFELSNVAINTKPLALFSPFEGRGQVSKSQSYNYAVEPGEELAFYVYFLKAILLLVPLLFFEVN